MGVLMVGKPVLYPRVYPWLLIAAVLDVFLTWFILCWLDGVELNPLAARLIDQGGISAATAYKFTLVALLMCICEYVGRHRPPVGRTLLIYAVAANGLVIVFSLLLIAGADPVSASGK